MILPIPVDVVGYNKCKIYEMLSVVSPVHTLHYSLDWTGGRVRPSKAE